MRASILTSLVFSFCIAPATVAAQATAEIVVSEETPPADPAVPPPPAYATPAPIRADVIITGPAYAPAPAPSPVYVAPSPGVYTAPAEPVVRRRVNWALLGAGIAMLAGGWVLTFVSTSIWYDQTTACTGTGWFSYSCTHTGPGGAALGWSFLPVLGPWLMLTDEYMDSAGEIAFPILAGLVQDTGLVLLILGAVLRDEVVEEPPVAGNVRFNGGASAQGFFGTMDVTF